MLGGVLPYVLYVICPVDADRVAVRVVQELRRIVFFVYGLHRILGSLEGTLQGLVHVERGAIVGLGVGAVYAVPVGHRGYQTPGAGPSAIDPISLGVR